jgi:serine phosphatase RsbU (regulator of sigma subunit)/pSer/pThr/pTyr-binding forkhead associated (FHA) protein
MQVGFLIAENDPAGPTQAPVGESLILGREEDCGLVVNDPSASRRHVKVFLEGDRYQWKDMGSTNGTLLNGTKMEGGALNQGDRIQIGDSIYRFEAKELAAPSSHRSDSTLFKSTLLDVGGGFQPRQADAGSSGRLLQALYTVINDIAGVYDPCAIIDTVLTRVVEAVPGHRCALFFVDGSGLKPCALCGHVHIITEGELGEIEVGELQVSHTVVNRVVNKGECVSYRASGDDQDLNDAASIWNMQLRSVMCVPLRGKQGVFGLLYLDTSKPGEEHSEEDVLLTTAIGNSVGLALENAFLQQQMMEKQRTDQEIEFAWTIQEGFLVKDWPPPGGAYDVYGETRPAKTVGGDFYDYVPLPENKVGLLIGDVSGKGVPAALTMAKTLAEFRVCAMETFDPIGVLRRLNASLVNHSQRGIFCTACFVVIDLEGGQIHCGNAGHHAPLIASATGVREMGDATGPPVGVLEGAQWDMQEATLTPGETLYLYTDGISEARPDTTALDTPAPDGDLDEFGTERITAAISALKDLSPRTVLTAVNTRLQSFCGALEPRDDCTHIALRYQGS